MQINITRKPKNTRYGSLAWASTLPVDKWIWALATCNDTSQHVDIYNGDQCIASILVSGINVRDAKNHAVGLYDCHAVTADSVSWIDTDDVFASVEYGGGQIGLPLMRSLYLFVQGLDLTVDDHGEAQFTAN